MSKSLKTAVIATAAVHAQGNPFAGAPRPPIRTAWDEDIASDPDAAPPKGDNTD